MENILSESNALSMNWNVQDKFKGMSLEEINESQPKFPYAVCMLNTTGSLNIGTALRSAVLFGAEKFYIVGSKRYDRRSTVGAQNYMDVERIDAIDENGEYDADKIIDKFYDDGYSPVMIEIGGFDISKILTTSNKKPCFIFGEEKNGIPKEMLEKCLTKFAIPTYGVLRSLNVSVAASIVMYEYSKRFEK